jgi:putative phosphoribosyl transferase
MCSYIADNEPVLLWTGRAMLDGRASIPGRSDAIVLIAGLGGTFHHERIRGIAARLNDEGFATIIADILTPDEQQFDARTGHFRVDVEFLAGRIGGVVNWMKHDELTRDLPISIFATADAAAAAVIAASRNPVFSLALVNPRIEPMRTRLSEATVPTLLLVDDTTVSGMPESVHVERVPGLGSILDNDVAAETVATHVTEWVRMHMPAPAFG